MSQSRSGIALIMLASAAAFGCGGASDGPSTRPQAPATTAPTTRAAAPTPTAPTTMAPAGEAATATTPGTATAALPAEAVAEAETIYAQRCVTCHGASGRGEGPAAAALNPKPRDYSDAAWQASVTDEHLANVILKGGSAAGLSVLMPPNPDLASKPDVVKALVAKIRGFKS